MTLNNPYALIWALAAAPLGLLYLRCVRPPVRRVATGIFWEEALGCAEKSDAGSVRRHVGSLLLLLAILGLTTLAMADPVGRPPTRAVLVIDHSLEDLRFEQAKQTATRWIDQMGERDQIGLVAGGEPSWIACPPTNRRNELLAALERITPVAQGGGLEQATQAAQRLLQEEGGGGSVVVLSDAQDVEAALAGLGRSAAPWWPWLVWLALLAAVAEWILFHRGWST